MDANKRRAHNLARRWWKSQQAEDLVIQGFAVCDRCTKPIAVGAGFLCEPKQIFYVVSEVLESPDLICDNCFELDAAQAWQAWKRRATTFEEMVGLKPLKKWWQFWR